MTIVFASSPNKRQMLSQSFSQFSNITADPYFEYTTLLLPGNGTNGAQNNTFLDGSTNNFTITRNGNTTQGTFSPFSQTGWGNYFDGTGDYLSVASNAAFNLSTNAFCVETWFYPTVSTGQIVTWSVPSTGIEINLSSGTVTLDLGSGSTWFISAVNCGTAVLNAWNHIAIVKNSSGNIGAFLNGNRNYSTTNTTAIGNANTFVSIGASRGASNYFTGYFSNFRYVNGSSVYDPTQTTLTVPTAPLTAITNTSLLTCQSNRFIDNSTNNFTITVNGDTRVVAFSPFNPTASWSAATNGGSGYFDGSGDYLTVPDNAALELGTANFTIELWVYPTSFTATTNNFLIGKMTNSTTASGFLIRLADTTGTALFYASSNGSTWDIANSVGTVAPTLNTWNHIAVSRSGSNFRIWVNGVSGGTTTSSGSIQNNTSVVGIGAVAGGGGTTFGYISDARIVNGTAVYDPTQTTLTVPTAPLTAITNTSLLLNYTNAGIYDATSKNDLETVGNAQISTSVSKFGGGSIAFDGTGDYLVSRYPTADMTTFGTGDFTIEMWIRFTNTSPTPERIFLDFRPGAGNQIAPMFYVLSNTVRYYVNGFDRITSATISSGQWYHLAVARSGTSTKMFIDGTQSGSTYTDSNNYISGASYPVIGAARDGTQGVDGYIDDLRITKGIARYTANFTPPTAAFPTL